MTKKGKVLAAIAATVVIVATGTGLYFKGGELKGMISLNTDITKAELAKLIVESTSPDLDISQYAEDCFTDVSADSWYSQYVCYLAKKEIMQGFVDGTFGPGEKVNRAEAALTFWNAYVDTIGGQDNIPQNVATALLLAQSPYSDVTSNTWFSNAVTGDAALGILDIKGWASTPNGGKAKFYPTHNLTKGRATYWANKLKAVLGN